MKNKKRAITEHDKSSWKKLDELEDFSNTIEGKWKQKGPYIINTGSRLDYGIYIGNDKKLVGVDEGGKPIIKSR